MDQELFELSKEVYKRTKWGQYGDEGLDYWKDGKGVAYAYPLYTSDYLLEKLPRKIEANDSRYFFAFMHGVNSKWVARYEDVVEHHLAATNADAPIKALLKLVIALDDAGELK